MARPSPWILGPRADSFFLLGGLAWSAAMAVTARLGGAAALSWIFILFQVGFNLPHYFQTYTLTYLDPEARGRNRPRLVALGALSISLPLAALLVPSKLPLQLLTTAILLWGFWHILQQSWGLVALYLRRAGVADPSGRLWARASLTLGCGWPLLWRISQGTLGFERGGISQGSVLPRLPLAFSQAALALTLVSALGYALWLTRQISRGLPAAPRAAWLVALTALQFWVGFVLLHDFLLSIVFLTGWHCVQYLALVFCVQRRRNETGAPGGWPKRASNEEIWYFALAMAFALLAGSFADLLPRPWGDAIYLPLVLAHYLNDGWLWRRQLNPNLPSWLPTPT